MIIEKKNTLMIAHRGMSGLEKENTAASFIVAGAHNYFGIECDIHKTIDNIYVVIHDDNTSRVSPLNLMIKDSTYEILRDIMLYDNNGIQRSHLRIPTLDEYLDICIRYQKACVIELKDFFTVSEIKEIINIIERKNYLEHCIFISFIVNNLLFLRELNSKFSMQLLANEVTNDMLNLCCKYRFDVDINYKGISNELIKKLHFHNIKVNAWTVDDPSIATLLINWGVDYITTNILE